MGANRPGARRTARLKRAKKHNERLARKATPRTAEPKGVVAKVKSAAKTAAAVVGAAVEGIKEGLAGKKEPKEKKETAKKPAKEKDK